MVATAVVTGASRGIGLAVARACASRGARVAMLARSPEPLAAAAASLGPAAIAVPCDVTDARAVAAAVDRITNTFQGPPDMLVNNAGLFHLARADDTAVDEFAHAVEVNLVAPFRCIRAFLPAMRARGRGHIVSIGSVADRHAFPENAAYSAGKFGLRGLHEVLRVELRGTGVRSTLVSPAAVDTELWDAIAPERRAGLPPRSAMLDVEAVAAAVLWAVDQPDAVNVDELRLSRS